MYSDDPVPVTFKADVDIVDQIVDWFGDEVTFEAGKAGKDQVREGGSVVLSRSRYGVRALWNYYMAPSMEE